MRGRLSSPTFIDYNDDGLQDILVGALNAHPRVADSTQTIFQLQLYKNVGTNDIPAYQLVDDDYLDGSTAFLRFQGAAPVAGDLDFDGDDDLLIGNWEGKIMYYQNNALAGQEAIWTLVADGLTEQGGLEIDEGSFSAPELFDIDNDQDLDLFIGDDFGRIAFYENVGNQLNLNFKKITDEWGGINFKDPITDYEFLGRTKPRFVDYDQDGITELLLGTEYGLIEVYEDISNALTDTLQKSGNFMGMDFGGFPSPAVAKIDSSGDYSVIVGLARGGMMLVNTLEIVEDTTNTSLQPPLLAGEDFQVFPNPNKGEFQVQFSEIALPSSPRQIEVFNGLGQMVFLYRKQRISNFPQLSQLSERSISPQSFPKAKNGGLTKVLVLP